MAGEVRAGDQTMDKPGARVAEDAEISVKSANRYVGRGGLKLEAALRHFAIDPAGQICLDIGASTGGFTDCLLQRGAAKVHAIDVGHNQLHWKIRSDPRVVVREKLNARYLKPTDVPDPIALGVIDVSFISLNLILPAAFELLIATGVIVALIKPQFELGRGEVEKGGIVRDPRQHAQAVAGVQRFVCEKLGKKWCGVIASPILGTEGNQEFLACLRH